MFVADIFLVYLNDRWLTDHKNLIQTTVIRFAAGNCRQFSNAIYALQFAKVVSKILQNALFSSRSHGRLRILSAFSK